MHWPPEQELKPRGQVAGVCLVPAAGRAIGSSDIPPLAAGGES